MPDAEGNVALIHRDPTHDYPVLVRGEAIYLYDDRGKRYVDGGAGAGNVTLGHGRREIVQAMAEQGQTLAFCFSANFTTQPALDLAARVGALAPGDLNHVYFVSGGSEGIETAIKMARLYHLHRGRDGKHLVISRWRGYHGATLGALSATGMPGLRTAFAPLLLDFPHIGPCYPYRCPFAGGEDGCEGGCNLQCARELEQAIVQTGPENVAAFVAEPVVSAGIAAGVPPPGYYPLIREICDAHDVLFIADEVITGFGRTGRYFAIEHWDVVPDMIVFGKGVSSGYCPLGGVILREEVHRHFSADGAFFPHIFTYVNNPVGMRAGLAVLDIIEAEGVLARAARNGDYLLQRARELEAHPCVGDVRGKGMMLGIELVQDKETREPFPASLEVAKRLGAKLMERGLSAAATAGTADWVNGDDVRLNPPLIITPAQIDEVIGLIDTALGELEHELRR